MKSLAHIFLTFFLALTIAVPSSANAPMFRYKALYFEANQDPDDESEEQEIPDAVVVPGVEPTVVIQDPTGGGTIVTMVGDSFSLDYEVTNANAVSSLGRFPPGMVIDVNTRSIVGTPSVVGRYTFNMKAYARVDGEVLTGESNVVTVEVVEPFSIITSGVADMLVGEPFSITLSSTRPDVTYQIDQLPSWMTFENGVISGENAEIGVWVIRIIGQTPEGDLGRGSVTVAVSEYPDASYEEGLAIVGEPFELEPTTKGGKLSFMLSGGSLPDGLDMAANGLIRGVPTQTGLYEFEVNAGRLTEFSDFGPFAIRVQPPLAISGAVIEDTYDGGEIVVAEQPSASGGHEPYVWSIQGFPGLVEIDPDTGIISGDQGSTSATVKGTVVVEDASGRIARKTVSYEILDPQIEVAGIRDAMVGVPFTAKSGAPVQPKVSGGIAPYSWALARHPSWISIDNETGVISGTPTATGEVEFDVLAEDANGIVSETMLSFSILPPLEISAPSFGPTDIGETLSVLEQPAASGGDGDYQYRFGDRKIAWMSISKATGELGGSREDVPGNVVSVVVEDGAGYEAESVVSVDLGTGLSISAPRFETAYVNEPVTIIEQPSASGGLGPYVWMIDTSEPNNLGVSIDEATGVLTVPTSMDPEEYEFTISLTDQNGFSNTMTASVLFNSRLSMSPPVVGIGMVNRDLEIVTPASASGGIQPLSWTSPDAPAWLRIGETGGWLAGTPTSAVDGGFTLTVSDADGNSVSERVSLRVLEELIVVDPEFDLTPHSQSVVVLKQPSASGGEGPYDWSVIEGPAWLELNSNGVISGTASTSYDDTVMIEVAEANGFTARASAMLQVGDALKIIPPIIEPQKMGYQMVVGRQVNAVGGYGTYSWSIEGRPSWMAFSETTGAITGMPSQNGSYPFTLTVTDEVGVERSVEVVVVVGISDLDLVEPVFKTTISGLSVNVQRQPTASGGVKPYEYRLQGEPAWLDIDPDTGVIGGVSGEPGSYSFSVGAVDAEGSESWVTTTLEISAPIGVSNFPLVREFQIVGTSFVVNKHGYPVGGDGTYNWSMTGNPAWLSIRSPNGVTGVLSGTVGDTGRSDVTVSVADAGGDSVSGEVTFTAVERLSIEEPVASYLVRNEPIIMEKQPVSVGGLPIYRWTLNGDAPSWLDIDRGTGVLSGTPDTDDTYSFNIVLEDGSNQIATRPVVWEIFELGMTPPVVLATVGQEIEVLKGLKASGGDENYTWTAINEPAWLTLSSNGVMTGVPVNAGTVSFQASVSDGSGTTITETIEFEVRPQLVLSAPVVPEVQEQNAILAVSSQPSVAGGSGQYEWSLTGAPASIAIDSETGVLSGLLNAPFEGEFVVRVVDDEGRAETADVDLTVIETLQIAGAALGSVQTRTEELNVTSQPAATGGVEPYTWSVSDAPAWLGLDQSTGELSGNIDVSGVFGFTLTVTDADGRTAEVSLGGTSYDPLVMSNVVFGNSVVDEPLIIDDQPAASGGRAPYTWTIASSPAWLNIDEDTGELSGSTNIGQEGAYNTTITVTDAQGRVDIETVAFNVYDIMALTQGVLSAAYENVELVFDNQPAIAGGKAPYTWGMSGNPDWLNIDMATGALSGTPTAQGMFSFDLEVIDAAGRLAAVSMSIFVEPEPTNYDEFVLAQTLEGVGSERLAISDDGSTLVVGMTSSSTDGEILIYEKQNGQMVLAAQLGAPVTSRNFGYAVGISGDGSTVAVTRAVASGSSYGALFIYKKVAGSWANTQIWDDYWSAYPSYDNFGFQVAVDYDGDTVAVGSRMRWGSYSYSGGVFMFEDNAGTLELQTVVRTPSNGDYSFGAFQDLEIDDAGEMVIGYLATSGGALGYFKKTNGVWPSSAWNLVSGSSSNNAGRGFAISPDGQRLAYYQEVAPDGKGDAGSVRLAELSSNGVSWGMSGHFTSNDAFSSDLFGYSIDFGKDNDELIAGARADDDRGGNTGSVYVFNQIDGAWVQMQKILPDDVVGGDQFGSKVVSSANGSTMVATGGDHLYVYTR